MENQFIKPFRGLRYNTDKISSIAQCVCPPYDVISDSSPYYAQDPHNIIRLELPKAEPPLNQYENAKKILDQWIDSGVITTESVDAIYVYEQEFDVDGRNYTRHGFFPLVRLDKNRILTHEQTKKKAKEDRKLLISTTKTSTSIIFGLYEDQNGEIERIISGPQKELLYSFTDEQSIENRFYRMTDTEQIRGLVNLMETRNVYIADGHHRLDVSYQLGLSYIPIYLTSMEGDGIVVLPYHRTVKFNDSRELNDILSIAGHYMTIERVDYNGKDSLRQVLDRVAVAKSTSCAILSKEDPSNLYIFRENSAIPLPDTTHDVLRKLKVNIIHSGLMKTILSIDDEEISFTHDAYEAADQLAEGSFDMVFFLPPTLVKEVRDIADAGLDMPPKSTFFYPKILTGLVLYRYA